MNFPLILKSNGSRKTVKKCKHLTTKTVKKCKPKMNHPKRLRSCQVKMGQVENFGVAIFFRRNAKDYEKTTNSAEAWILPTDCQIILNRNIIFKHFLTLEVS